MENKGVMIGGVFRTFDEIRKAANETAKIWRGHSTFEETILALLDHIAAMERDKARAQRRAFGAGAEWGYLEFGLPMEKKNMTKAQAEAATRYTAPSHIDEALAENLAQDTGGNTLRGAVTDADVLKAAEKVWGNGQFDNADMLLEFYNILSRAQRPMPTREQVEEIVKTGILGDLKTPIADAIMALFGMGGDNG